MHCFKPTLIAVLAALTLSLSACPSAPQTDRTDPSNPYASGAQHPWEDTDISGLSRTALSTGNLSDQPWASATNGWGPVERNRSNGEQQSADGKTIRLGGVGYAKGLGVHASSRIAYALSGSCTSFQAEIGIDDEVRFQTTRGSVVFQVWADGNKLYDSGVMTHTTATKSLNVNLTGRTRLELVVTDAGDGNWYDHADWANPRVGCNAAITSPAKPAWSDVRSWGVQYQGFNASTSAALNALDASSVELLVVGRFDGTGKEWQSNDVTRLAKKKWVFSYIAAGQAQVAEPYWQSWWRPGNPAWLLAASATYSGTYEVAYWDPRWQAAVFGIIDRVIANGFDGAFLDQSDPYWNPGFPGGPSAQNMVRSRDLVCGINRYAKAKKPDFKIFVNGGGNEIDLFGSSYWSCADAVAGEHLWFNGTGYPERTSYRDWTIPLLKRLVAAGKKVFTFDFTNNQNEIVQTVTGSRSNGFIPAVTGGSLNTTPVAY